MKAGKADVRAAAGRAAETIALAHSKRDPAGSHGWSTQIHLIQSPEQKRTTFAQLRGEMAI
jgi:hypothetical protein